MAQFWIQRDVSLTPGFSPVTERSYVGKEPFQRFSSYDSFKSRLRKTVETVSVFIAAANHPAEAGC